ncbi:MAG: RluA family pseudouridine synthase, partial [Bacilli bacterium]|nr:RluA family pseudouridine synthase [Bacilli bacterium]
MQKFVINKFDSNQSLFKYVKKVLKNAPLSFVYRIFRKKDVKVNGKRESDKYVLKENDEILLYITDDQYAEFTREKELAAKDEISSYIIYEDKNIIVINKPRGMLVQGDGSRDVSLDVMVNEYLMFKGKEGNFLSAPCHRIDRNTSGLVVFAKSIEVTQLMTKLF